jgi:acyl-CoA thioesterase FadM
MGDEFTEILLSREPVIVRRCVQWGECDPAGVVYSPRFADFAASAFLWFMRIVLRPSLADDNIGSPLKAMSFQFHATLKPGEFFDMRVLVGEVRHRSFDLCIDARGLAGEPRFSAQLSPILIDRRSFTSILIPERARQSLRHYGERFGLEGGRDDPLEAGAGAVARGTNDPYWRAK